MTPLVIPPQMPPTSREGRLLRDRSAPIQAADPARWPPEDEGVELRVGQPRRNLQLPGVHHRAHYHRPVRIKWINELVDKDGDFLPHLLPVDPTLHWANPPGGATGRDSRPTAFDATPGPYDGPVPIVTHVHGNHAFDYSARYAEAWYLPDARNLPAGFATEGTFYDYFRDKSPLGAQWRPGNAVFEYPNDRRATTMWYHDHTLGMTRLNVYAGPAGFYLLRRGPGDPASGRHSRARSRFRRSGRNAVLRNPTRHPGSLVQQRRLVVLPGHQGVLR